MEKYVIDERTGWEYELKGEQYYPTGRVMKNGIMVPDEVPEDIEPEDEPRALGIWSQRHLRFIRQHRKHLYLDLYMAGSLNVYLAEIEAQAEDLFSRLVKEMAEKEGVTEKLKAEDQIRWVGMINNIRHRATELVNEELIFA